MYDFAVVALLALATLKLVDFLTDAVPQLARVRSLLTFVIAVGATLLIDYSVFKAWGVPIRDATSCNSRRRERHDATSTPIAATNATITIATMIAVISRTSR